MTKPDFTPDAHSMKMEISRLRTQLAKANERVNELEQESKEFSMLIANLVRRVDVKTDLLQNPTYEKASVRLNKFAIEKKIEALDSIEFGWLCSSDYNKLDSHVDALKEQLRKEQEK